MLEHVSAEREQLLSELDAAHDQLRRASRLRHSLDAARHEKAEALANVKMLEGIVKGLKEELAQQGDTVRQLRKALVQHRRQASHQLAEASALVSEEVAMAAARERTKAASALKLSAQLSEAQRGLSRATRARLSAQQQLQDARQEARSARVNAEQAAAFALDVMKVCPVVEVCVCVCVCVWVCGYVCVCLFVGFRDVVVLLSPVVVVGPVE